MADKVIKLSRAYEVHGKSFDSVTLREPRYAEYIKTGDVMERQQVGDGAAIITYHDRIESYADKLLMSPEPGGLAELNLLDAMRVEQAIVDFFTEARQSLRQPTS